MTSDSSRDFFKKKSDAINMSFLVSEKLSMDKTMNYPYH